MIPYKSFVYLLMFSNINSKLYCLAVHRWSIRTNTLYDTNFDTEWITNVKSVLLP